MKKEKHIPHLNEKQDEVFNLIQDIIGDDVIIEPLSGDGLKLIGTKYSHIKEMMDRGLIVFYLKPGKTAVFKGD